MCDCAGLAVQSNARLVDAWGMGENQTSTTPSHLRLGDVLVEQGLLNESDVEAILNQQHQTGRPFGEIAETMCNVSSEAIEEAWACQYEHNAPTMDPVKCTPRADACALVTARQAWQFRCLPMSLEDDTLVIATTKRHIHRALRFATRVLDRPAYFVMTSEERLAEALAKHYPLCGTSSSKDSEVSSTQFNTYMTKMRMDRVRKSG